MDKLYTDLNNSASYSSVKKLYNVYKKENPGTTIRDVARYLHGVDSYTLHKITKNNFSRRSYFTSRSGKCVCVDVAYVHKLSKTNDNLRYLMFFIDLFSRYLCVYPLKSLKACDVIPVLKTFFSDCIYKYKKIHTDRGQEFLSNQAKNFYRSQKIHHYVPLSAEKKNSIAERSIRTIKGKMYKFFTHTSQTRYIEALKAIVKTYNYTPHRGILNMTPIDLHLLNDNERIFNIKMRITQALGKTKKNISHPHDVGSYVRLKLLGSSINPFRTGYNIRNTREIFKIVKMNKKHFPITYTISDLSGKDESVHGVFYHDELIPVVYKDIFDINILKTRIRKKKKEYLVSYIHYPNEDPTWIQSTQLVK